MDATVKWRHNKNSNLARQEGKLSRTTVPQLRGEMSSKLWLIVANLQMHRPTLPPKGMRYLSPIWQITLYITDKEQLYALLKIKEKKHIY